MAMSTIPDGWISVIRPDDGETVGYLEPVTEDYAQVQPRTVLGHPVGEPNEFLEAEELLIQRGISELGGKWVLRERVEALGDIVVIVELSPHGIVVAHADVAYSAKFNQRVTVPWPDLAGALVPAGGPDRLVQGDDSAS